jgi:hypothetical protein
VTSKSQNERISAAVLKLEGCSPHCAQKTKNQTTLRRNQMTAKTKNALIRIISECCHCTRLAVVCTLVTFTPSVQLRKIMNATLIKRFFSVLKLEELQANS